MFSKLRIGPRLILLILVQTALILTVGVVGLLGLNQATQTTQQLNANVTESARTNGLMSAVHGGLLPTVHGVNNGTLTWSEGRERLAQAATGFFDSWDRLVESAAPEDRDFLEDVLAPWRPGVEQAFDEASRLFEGKIGSTCPCLCVMTSKAWFNPLWIRWRPR